MLELLIHNLLVWIQRHWLLFSGLLIDRFGMHEEFWKEALEFRFLGSEPCFHSGKLEGADLSPSEVNSADAGSRKSYISLCSLISFSEWMREGRVLWTEFSGRQFFTGKGALPTDRRITFPPNSEFSQLWAVGTCAWERVLAYLVLSENSEQNHPKRSKNRLIFTLYSLDLSPSWQEKKLPKFCGPALQFFYVRVKVSLLFRVEGKAIWRLWFVWGYF